MTARELSARKRHRPQGPPDLRRLLAVGPDPRRPGTAVGGEWRNRPPRRDAVHRPAPGFRALDEAPDPRAQGRDRARAAGRARRELQDPVARQDHPETAVRMWGYSRRDAVRYDAFPPNARNSPFHSAQYGRSSSFGHNHAGMHVFRHDPGPCRVVRCCISRRSTTVPRICAARLPFPDA